MAEHGLDTAEIRAAAQKVSGKRVAEHVGVDGAGRGAKQLQALEHRPVGTAIKTSAAGADEEERRDTAVEEGGTSFVEIFLNSGHSGSADGEKALAITFAGDAEAEALWVQVGEFDCDEFADAEAGGIAEFEHGLIAETKGSVGRNCLGETGEFFGAQGLRKAAGGFRIL